MKSTGWIALLVIALAVIYMTAPNFRRSRVKRWRHEVFAHRGLHNVDAGIVENTLPAFEAACENGYGMELDIQLTKDFQLVVFHDDTLKRLTGDPRRVDECTLSELQSMPLHGIDSARIPTFREMLDLVNGRTPLLIELKSGKNNVKLCEMMLEQLKGYRGEYIVESFNPLIVAWFRYHAPQLVRGQLVCPMKGYYPAANQTGAFLMAGLLLNFIARPDFVAYDANAKRFFSPHFQRFIFHTPMAAWTVRSEALQTLIEKRGEISIFERIRVRKRNDP